MAVRPLTVSFSGASQRLTSRFSSIFPDIATTVVPVLVVGTEETDLERQQFGFGFAGASGVGQFPAVVMLATKPVVVEALWVWSATAQNVAFFTDDDDAGNWSSISAPTYFTAVDGMNGGSTSLISVGSAVGGFSMGGLLRWPIAVNVAIQILARPFLLPANRRLVAQGQFAASTISANYFARCRDA